MPEEAVFARGLVREEMSLDDPPGASERVREVG
jgi:hypothetical protein